MTQLSHSTLRGPVIEIPRPARTAAPAVLKAREIAPSTIDESLFGKEIAAQHRADDSEAFAAVSWILFAIVLSGCLLMLGTVLWVS